MTDSALLQCEELTFELPDGRRLIDEVTLTLDPGDFAILLGGNGSGKTTFIRLLNGLCRCSSGQIMLEGRGLSPHVEDRAAELVTLTQDLRLSSFSDLTVLENCLLAAHRRRCKRQIDFAPFLERFHTRLPARLHTPTGRLSGGERQILGFALACLASPKLLLLDEHTSALDPVAADELMRLTATQVHERRLTTLMTTHRLDDALRYGNRLLAMRQGKIVLDVRGSEKEQLTKDELFRLYT